MSEIESLVLGELKNHPELMAMERGVAWKRTDGETRLWFTPTSATPSEFKLCSIAHIETVFGPRAGTWKEDDIARLNKRACFGYFTAVGERLKLKASFSIFEKEPAARWVAIVLLRALGEQLALGFGIGQSFRAPEALPGNRSNLEYPRHWKQTQDIAVFEQTAERFRRIGFMSTPGDQTVVLEVALDGGSPSRMLDPKAETALLHVSADVKHPIAGCGYYATIALPYDPDREELPRLCAYLNSQEELQEDFVPRLGAWGMRALDNELVYSLFWPTDQPDDGLPGTIMNWMVQRTLWVKDHYWKSGVGISIEELSNA